MLSSHIFSSLPPLLPLLTAHEDSYIPTKYQHCAQCCETLVKAIIDYASSARHNMTICSGVKRSGTKTLFVVILLELGMGHCT